MHVQGTSLRLPPAYGSPTAVLTWESVERTLADAPVLWLVTTRADGRPHAVPVDAVWWDAAVWFGGDPATVHERNLRRDPRVVLHVESGRSPVIVEGTVQRHVPDPGEAEALARASTAKYGYAASAESYGSGVWRLRPTTVVAWTVLYEDATRFDVEPGPPPVLRSAGPG